MTQSDPTGVHDWHADAYIQEWIGSYEHDERRASLLRLPDHIPFDPDAAIRVLDIGGGWGPVTRVVLEEFPLARVVLHDFSGPMLEEATRRLASYGDAVSFHRGDLMSPAWKVDLVGPFDAVVSSLAIHNVRFPDRIRAIYAEVFPLVAPGGCFLNLDSVSPGPLSRGATRHAQQMERRRQVHDEAGEWSKLSEVATPSRFGRVPHVDAEPTAADLQRIAAAEPATLANQLRWLVEAGFDEADCLARDRSSALLAGFRSRA